MLKYFLIFFSCLLVGLSCHSQSAVKADSLRLKYQLTGVCDSALYYAQELEAIMSGIKGENTLEYAGALNKLAIAYFYLGSYKKSEFYILQEIALREKLKAENDIAYLNALEEASVICRKAGNYDEALIQVKKAERKSSKIYGEAGSGYARTVSLYGDVLYDRGVSINDGVFLKETSLYLDRAQKINSISGTDICTMTINKYDRAVYNDVIGNLPLAESLFREVVDLTGSGFPDANAAAVNNLGVFYFYEDNFRNAEKNFLKVVEHFDSKDQRSGLQKAICICNLAAIYNSIGNYAAALKLLGDAGKVFENKSLQSNPVYAVFLNNMAVVYMTQEYFAEAKNKNAANLEMAARYIGKADSIFNMNCRYPHPVGSILKTNHAILYYLRGDKVKCEQILFDESYETNLSMKIYVLTNKMAVSEPVPVNEAQKKIPQIQPMIIPFRMDFLFSRLSAESHILTSEGASPLTDGAGSGIAEIMFGKANNVKKDVGEYHPAYITALRSLIAIHSAFNNESYTEDLTIRLNNCITYKLLQDFTFLSESEKEMYYQSYLPDINSFMTFILDRKKRNPSVTKYAYNSVLLNKGLMLKSSTAMRVAILNSNDPELLKSYDRWIALQKEISDLYSTPVDLRTKDVSVLEKDANEIERSLVERSQDFGDYRKGLQVTWEDVSKNLKTGEAAIEFTDFRNKSQDGGNDVIYCALVVMPDSHYPEMIRLFTERELTDVIGNVNNASSVNRTYGTLVQQDERLYNLIWKPVEPYLKGVKNIYISPSGLLNKISFPAINSGKNVFLCDSYNIQVESSTGNLAFQKTKQEKNTSALIFGGIRYGNDKSGSTVWNYLEGTRNEGDTVMKILQKSEFNVNYLTEEKATEAFFKENAGKYDILHIATHGFFFDDPAKIKFEEKENIDYSDVTFRGSSSAIGVSSFVNNENPLMRSGIVFAGANDVWSRTESNGQEDGVLTAQEVTQIDMRKNNLVVLSACETGLGDIRGNEGVYGLQRSLKMAGVKDIIMSLWEIPDRETVEFMGKFYRHFAEDHDIRKAFSQAQHEMRMKYDPYFWGAFVLLE